MDKRIATFTIFTFLLLAVSTALDPASDLLHKSSTESTTVADSDVLIPAELKSDPVQTTVNHPLPKSDTTQQTQTFEISTFESTPRLIFSRSVPIQRHSFDATSRIPLRFVRRHPCRKFKQTFMIPTEMMSYGNDMVLSDKTTTTSVDLETIGDQMPTKWLGVKHKYGHRHHHYHHDKDEKFEIKYEYDRENRNGMSGHRKEKKEHKGGFMKRVRKFLKHTFDD